MKENEYLTILNYENNNRYYEFVRQLVTFPPERENLRNANPLVKIATLSLHTARSTTQLLLL